MEIGGYLEFETFHGSEYHNGAIRLNSGRNCLAYLIEAKNIQKIALPYLICSSIIDVCRKYNVQMFFYHINAEFQPIFGDNLSSDIFLYIINHYGQLTDEYCQQLVLKYGGKIIIDNAHAFFRRPIPNIDTIYTCRKFFGVPDGAYLYTNTLLNKELHHDISYQRIQHLLGRFEVNASRFYQEYLKNETAFSFEPIKKMSRLTQNILKGIDYEIVKQKRTENYKYLFEKLLLHNKLKLNIIDGAYMYPLYLDNSQKLRDELLINKVYIPTLWPNVLNSTMSRELEHKYSENILPIPVDQRYQTSDLSSVIEIIIIHLDKEIVRWN